MADSIREKIIKNIVTTLEGILTVNGYQEDIKNVQRFKLPSMVTTDYPYLLVQEDGEASENLASGVVVNRLNFAVVAVANHPETETRASNEILDVYHVDINKALMVDPTRGALAINTEYNGYDEIDFEEGETTIAREMRFQVRYEHDWKDMTLGV